MIIIFHCVKVTGQPLSAPDEYALLMELTEKTYFPDQVLSTGVCFDDVYWNAEGHPYMGEDRFVKGDILYRNTNYFGLEIKYDICHQRVLLLHHYPAFDLVTILANEFLDEFIIDGKKYKKLEGDGSAVKYFQVISDETAIKCYCFHTRTRKENLKNDRIIYSFSEERKKMYLLVNSTLIRFYNNRSFTTLFDTDEDRVNAFLKSRKVRISRLSAESLGDLIVDIAAYLEVREEGQ